MPEFAADAPTPAKPEPAPWYKGTSYRLVGSRQEAPKPGTETADNSGGIVFESLTPIVEVMPEQILYGHRKEAKGNESGPYNGKT
jgi:hypothetical protein